MDHTVTSDGPILLNQCHYVYNLSTQPEVLQCEITEEIALHCRKRPLSRVQWSLVGSFGEYCSREQNNRYLQSLSFRCTHTEAFIFFTFCLALPLSLCFCLSLCLFLSLSVCLFRCLTLLSLCRSASVSFSFWLFECQSLYLSVCLSLSFCFSRSHTHPFIAFFRSKLCFFSYLLEWSHGKTSKKNTTINLFVH